MISKALTLAFGDDFSKIRILDIGCGKGEFLRSMLEYGVAPRLLHGTEFLENRIQTAKTISHPDIKWFFKNVPKSDSAKFDLVSAQTVFSSILEEEERRRLAVQIWDQLRPGGWVLVFDFRYNNPKNSNVRKVTREELSAYWSSSVQEIFFTDMLMPPLARRLIRSSWVYAELLTSVLQIFRSHFVYTVKRR